MPKRSHLLLLTIAVDAMLVMGAVQAQAEEIEDEPPLIIQIYQQPPSSTISNTLPVSTFPTIKPNNPATP